MVPGDGARSIGENSLKTGALTIVKQKDRIMPDNFFTIVQNQFIHIKLAKYIPFDYISNAYTCELVKLP